MCSFRWIRKVKDKIISKIQISGSIWVKKRQKWAKNFLFQHKYQDFLLDTIIYHNMQYQQNLMNGSWEMSKKPRIWGEIDQKWPKSSPLFFFSKIGRRHFSTLIRRYFDAKKLRNPMVGNMRILRHGQTDVYEMESSRNYLRAVRV